MSYKLTVGLEVHAELRTATKMFCNSKNDPDETRPNMNICPVCMGHPGTLPVINKEAVKHVVRVGLAVGGRIADFTEFDRKNYFYPDIPKGYQISQYKHPLVEGGELAGVTLTRIHLEEDTARSSHDKGEYSLVDFNRAGVPLMELVTEPVIHDPETAGRFARELQLLLRTLGAGEANMEKGEMRVEANISVSATDTLGTKVEVKNLNSFRSVERAIRYEMGRHISALEAGEEIRQETRGWDEAKQATFTQRLKESSHDYRYFPDPDLPKIKLSELREFAPETLKKGMPELPWEKRSRYTGLYGLKNEVAEVLVQDGNLASLFDETIAMLGGNAPYEQIANYIVSDLVGLIKGDTTKIPSAANFAKLMALRAEGKIPTRVTKDVLMEMIRADREPEAIVAELGVGGAKNESEIRAIVAKIVSENPKVVEDYKSGKEASMQFLIGQGMRVTKGAADPGKLKELFLAEIGK